MPVSKGRAAKTARDAGKTKGSEAPLGKVWDTESKVDSYDGRENLAAGDSGGLDGKWNKIKSRRAVIVSKYNMREVK